MSANTRMFQTHNNLILLGLIAMAMNSFCAAAVEIPDYVLRENLYGPKLDNNLFGNEFGSVPGLVYGDSKEPYTDKIWAYNDRCNEMFEETSQKFSKARHLATVNYYPTTLDFQQFRNHDLIPENKKLYSFGNRLRKGHPAPGFNNEGQQVMHGTCEFSTPEGGTWTSERIGPFYSTGGYDWWQVGWADLFGLKKKLKGHPGGIYVDANTIAVTDKEGNPFDYPPIHIHHIHVLGQPGVRPRKGEYFCGINAPKPCYNWSHFFEWHGDYNCRWDMGGTDCLYESYPDGTAKHTFFPLDVEGEINDVRARGSPPLEWYFQVGMHWRYADEYERMKIDTPDILSVAFMSPMGRVDLNNQQTYVQTIPVPIDYDNMVWANWKMPASGELIRNKIHSHMTSFYKMILVSGDVARVLDKTYASPFYRAWETFDVSSHGYNSSQAMFLDVYNKITRDDQLELICISETDLVEVNNHLYDRKPITRCRHWNFQKGDDMFFLGWNVKKSFPFTLDETATFDGIIKKRTVPQHFAQFIIYKEPGRGNGRLTTFVGHRELDAAKMSWKEWNSKPPERRMITFEDELTGFEWQAVTWTQWWHPEMSLFSITLITIIVGIIYFCLPVLVAITPLYIWLKSKHE